MEASPPQGRLARLTRTCLAFCREQHKPLAAALAVCWFLLFFRHAFDYNERFFRIPLLLLCGPVLAGLPHTGLASYLRRSPLAWSVLGMILAACLAGCASPFPDVRSYSHIVFGWFVLSLGGLTMGLAFPGRAGRVLFLGTACGLLASAAWAFFCTRTGALDSASLRLGDERLMLFTGYPATLGLMAGAALTGLLHMLRHRQTGRVPLLALAAGTAALLVLSQARTALLAFCGAAFATLFRASRRPLRLLALALALFGIALVAALLLARAGTLQHSPAYQRMLGTITHPLEDPAISGRMAIWEAALGAASERPLLGYGLRMFPPAYACYVDKHGPAMREKYVFVEPRGGHAHNLFLGVLTEMGLLGLLPLLTIFLTVFRTRNLHPGSEGDCLRMLFVFFFLHGCTEYALAKIIYSDLFFGAVGLFAGAVFCGKNASGGQRG